MRITVRPAHDLDARDMAAILSEVIALNEAVARAAGALTPARVVGVALNTSKLSPDAAAKAVAALEDEVGLPVADPVREGGTRLARAVLASR